ncbi:PAN2-PAN3 deadenylation complex subunit PAN3 [Equus caballus]
MTNSSSSPSLVNDSAKPYAGHDALTSPASSLFNDFGALNISQRRKARKAKNPIGCLADRCKSGVPIDMVWWNRVTENNLQTPNPTASEFIPKGGSTSRLSNVSQSNMSAFSQVFSHPSMGSPAAAGLAPDGEMVWKVQRRVLEDQSSLVRCLWDEGRSPEVRWMWAVTRPRGPGTRSAASARRTWT